MPRFPRLARPAVFTFSVAATLAASAHAQRQEVHFDWQKHSITFAYGAPHVGKHSIDEFQVGTSWRLGSGDITTLTLEAPLVSGDSVVPPGVYRVNVGRPASDQFNLQVEGPGKYVDESGEVIVLRGTRHDATKPNEKLELRLTADKEQADAEVRRLSFVAQFGIPELEIPMTIVGSQSVKAKSVTLDSFKIPAKLLAERLAAQKHTPVAMVVRADRGSKDLPERMNLLLAEKEVLLLPTMKAPTESYGFGEIPKVDPNWILHGAVAWSVAAEPADHFRITAADVDKSNVLHCTAQFGARQAEIAVQILPSKR